MARTCCALARAVGALPLYFPAAFAFAMPSFWRESITPLSNSATAANIVKSILPLGDFVSISEPPKSRMRSHGTQRRANLRSGDMEVSFADPSEQLAKALDSSPPLVYIRVDDDLSWRDVQ